MSYQCAGAHRGGRDGREGPRSAGGVNRRALGSIVLRPGGAALPALLQGFHMIFHEGKFQFLNISGTALTRIMSPFPQQLMS